MKPVIVPLALDLQAMHDHARSVERAWGTMAETLAMSPNVCTHKYTPKEDVDADTVTCAACGRVVPLWMTER